MSGTAAREAAPARGAVAGAWALADNAAAQSAHGNAALDSVRGAVRAGVLPRSARQYAERHTTKPASSTIGTTIMDNAPSELDDDDALFRAAALGQQDFPAPALYVVATPIGNAADITLRALWILRHVDAIAAEDTRTTRPLLARFAIATRLFAAHQHNEAEAAAQISQRLAAGERIALVTDAGTPAISDPGAAIVRTVRAAGWRVIPVPGASSLTAAAASAGLQAATLHFLGFLPAAARARSRALRRLAQCTDSAAVLFEAPHRIRATVRELASVLQPERMVVLARELTKKFESIEVVRAADLVAQVEVSDPRGEYVLLVDSVPTDDAAAPAEIDAVTRRWLEALADELPAARAAAVAARATGLPRALLYRALSRPGRRD